MALSSFSANGTFQVAAVGTPQTIGGTITTAGIYLLEVDCTLMQAGDAFTVIVTSATANGGAATNSLQQSVSGVQTPTVKYFSTPVIIGWSGSFSFNQTTGTARVLPYTIWSL